MWYKIPKCENPKNHSKRKKKSHRFSHLHGTQQIHHGNHLPSNLL